MDYTVYDEYKIESMPIDDIGTLLNFYYDYQKNKGEIAEVRDFGQKTARLDYYFAGKQYTLYSQDAAKILDLITGKEEARGKMEMIKDKLTKRREHERELIQSIIKKLHTKLEEFFNDRVNF